MARSEDRLSLSRRICVAATSAILLSGAGGALYAAETLGIPGPPATAAKAAPAPPSERLRLDASSVPLLALGGLDMAAIRDQDAIRDRRPIKQLRIGVTRDVQILDANGAWTEEPDGSALWTVEVLSPGAIGLRVHFADLALRPGAELAVFSPDLAGASAEANPPQIRHGVARERNASFWSATFAGDRARVEYLAPAGAPREIPFRIDRIVHVYREVLAAEKSAAGSCENDVSCYPQWAQLADATGALASIHQGDFVYCSGTLLNTQAGDLTPYFLTANHCMDGFSGRDSEIFWLYQTKSCNAAPPRLLDSPRSEVTTLLSTSHSSDYALLMVEGALPGGLFFAGWTSTPVADGTDTVAIHHPSGDYKRISFGHKDPAQECVDTPGAEGVALVRNTWTSGVTEPGSSGSGLFRQDTSQLFGQLYFGPSSCDADAAQRYDCYGAFSATYDHIKGYLRQGSDDSSEPNDSCSASRVVRLGKLPNRILRYGNPDWYRVQVPAHATLTVTLRFRVDRGDIDLALYRQCGAAPVAQSATHRDGESTSFTNRGNRPVWIYVNPTLGGSDTRATYDLTVALR